MQRLVHRYEASIGLNCLPQNSQTAEHDEDPMHTNALGVAGVAGVSSLSIPDSFC